MANKKTIFHWVFTVLWIAVGAGTILLLAAAAKNKDVQHCSGISINIEGVDNNFFVDKKDVINSITLIVGGNPVGKIISAFDLREMENDLVKDVWIKTVQMFFDNNNRLMVNVLEREPVARVFSTKGTTFYIDSSLAMLPLSEKFSARLPVFTGFPSNKGVLSKPDSALLKGILVLSLAIQKDTFRTAIIDQVDITPQRNFELIPKIGNNIIVFGDAADLDEKFNKLQLFYQQVMVKSGWNKYSEINIAYHGQIVAKLKGAEDKSADSLRTLQLMQAIAYNAERQASDSLQSIVQDNENNSTNINLIQQSIERDPVAEALSESKLPVFNTLPRATIAKPLIINKVINKVLPLKRLPAVKPFKKIQTESIKKVEKNKIIKKVLPKVIHPEKLTKPTIKPNAKKQVLTKPANEY